MVCSPKLEFFPLIVGQSCTFAAQKKSLSENPDAAPDVAIVGAAQVDDLS
jgi:hypothetical protein